MEAGGPRDFRRLGREERTGRSDWRLDLRLVFVLGFFVLIPDFFINTR